jgi:hypothetical protein
MWREQNVHSALPRPEPQSRFERPVAGAGPQQRSFELANETLAKARHDLQKPLSVSRVPRSNAPRHQRCQQREQREQSRQGAGNDGRHPLPGCFSRGRSRWRKHRKQVPPDSSFGHARVPARKDPAVSSLRNESRRRRVEDLKPQLVPVRRISRETQRERCRRIARLDHEARELIDAGRPHSGRQHKGDSSGMPSDSVPHRRQAHLDRLSSFG